MNREQIIEKTMREFKDGKLYSSSGDLVTKRDQAIAIALSKANSKKFGDGGSVEQQNYEMVYSDNKAIIHHAEELKMILTKNKSIPTWAVTLISKAEQNLSDVTHYLDGKIKYEYGGMLPEILQKVYGEKLEFVDRHAQYQVGIINNLYPDHAEVIIDDKFFDVPNWRITRIITKDLELNKSLIKEIQDTYMLKQSADSSDSFALETMKDGGKVMIASLGAYLLAGETAKKIAPESVSAIDKKLASQINPEPKPSIWEDRGLKYNVGGPVNYKAPGYKKKIAGVYIFETKGKIFELEVYGYERENDTSDSLIIQNDLREELGSIIIKNVAWRNLFSGKKVMATSSKNNFVGTLRQVNAFGDGGPVGSGEEVEIIEIINFFEANDCEVEFDTIPKGFRFDVWSKISKRWILENANETQFRNFYDKVKNNYAKGGPVKSYPDLSLIKPDVVNDTIMVPEFEIKEPNKIIELDTLRVKKITNSQSATVILRDIWEPDTIGAYEQAYILYLNNANEVIGYYHHSSGGIAGTIMDVEMISAMAVKSLSRGVLIAHNHPSGALQPSPNDLRISKQLNDALALFNIPLLDSIIITKNNYYSLKDNGDL